MPGSDRPIIVGGCPRSGTTLMQLILHSHPRIAIPPETRFVQPVFRRRERFGDLTKPKNHRRLARAIAHHKGAKLNDLHLDRDELFQRILAAPPTVGSAIGTVFQMYAERYDKPRWGDKRPGYITNIEMMLRLFPDAQIVHVVRDGRDCVSSLKTMPWWKQSSVAAMAMWANTIDAGRAAARKYGPDTYYPVCYERLVSDPEPELRALCEFLGEDFDDAMLRPNQLAGEAVPERKTWHVNTAKEINTARVGRWTELEPWEVGLAERMLGGRLKARGYELSGEGSRPPMGKRVDYYRELLARKRAMRRRDAQAQAGTVDVAARLTSRQRSAAPAG
jgi:hypothetical protein